MEGGEVYAREAADGKWIDRFGPGPGEIRPESPSTRRIDRAKTEPRGEAGVGEGEDSMFHGN